MRPTFDFESNRYTRADSPGQIIPIPVGVDAPRKGEWSRPEQTKPVPEFVTWTSIAGAVVLALVGIFMSIPVLVLLALAIGFLLPKLLASVSAPHHLITQEDLKLLENEADLDVCLVGVTVYFNEKVIGRDHGVAWFGDGSLLYNGHRTSFVIGGQDLFPPEQWPRWIVPDGTIELPESILALRHPDGRAFVDIRPLIPPATGGGTPQEMRFLKRLYGFRRRLTVASGHRQWPPLER